MKNSYQNYFKEHYGSTFTSNDVFNYKEWFFAQFNFIQSKLNLNADKKILEVGSGFGGFYDLLSESSKRQYIGLELDSDAVLFASDYFCTDSFINQSIDEFSKEDIFDVVCAFEVLEHFDNPIRDIRKISSLLTENGFFVGTSPYPFKKNILADTTHNFVLHPENWRRLFLNNGFSEVSIFPMSFIPYVWRINKKLNKVLPLYIPFSKFISTSLIIARK